LFVEYTPTLLALNIAKNFFIFSNFLAYKFSKKIAARLCRTFSYILFYFTYSSVLVIFVRPKSIVKHYKENFKSPSLGCNITRKNAIVFLLYANMYKTFIDRMSEHFEKSKMRIIRKNKKKILKKIVLIQNKKFFKENYCKLKFFTTMKAWF